MMGRRGNCRGRLAWLGMALLLCGCDKAPEGPPTGTPPDRPAARPASDSAKSVEDPVGTILTLPDDAIAYAGIQVEAVSEREMAETIEATGRLILNEDRTVQVGAYVEGRVLEVLVQLGDRIKAGQVLAKIHTHEVHDAGANLAQARAMLVRKRTEAAFAKASLDRAERLLQARALSLYERDRIRVEEASAREEVTHAEAELERARGHIELLGLDEEKLDYEAPVLVRAPREGVLLARSVTPGTSVNPGDPLFTLSDLGALWVHVEVEEQQLPALRVGAPLTLSVAAYPGETFPGKILRLGEQLNPETRRLAIRGLVENRTGRLKPEMYVTARVQSGTRARVLTIPAAALQEVDGTPTVFIALGQNRYQRRSVRTGRSEDGQVEALEGVAVADRVVTKGSFLLKSELLKSLLEEDE
ncbi:MAG: efflux RND transporter periplasmic adaptor subunit [Blastocatellia bacterium]